jgi:type IV pilus assembly protein PilC
MCQPQPKPEGTAMKTFNYNALDAHGREKHGTVEVNDQREAINRLHEMGFFPTRICEIHQPPSRFSTREDGLPRAIPKDRRGQSGLTLLVHRVTTSSLANFTAELATLIDAGLPLLQSLRVLEQQESHRQLRGVIGQIARDVESGNSFSEALAKHPRVFPRLYQSLVQAGELGGMLDEVLARLAQFMDKSIRMRKKVVAAMVYPCAVIIIAFTILAVLMVYVVPGFREQFRDMLGTGTLPTFTEVVFRISTAVQKHFPLIMLAPVLIAVLVGVLSRTRTGRQWLDFIKISVPVLGLVFRKVALARFTRTLGTLMGSGVPILQALSVTKQTAGNVLLGNAIEAVHRSVKEGGPIAEPLAAFHLFPATLVSLVNVGEQTGTLPEMLLKLSDKYDADVDNAVSAMTALIEPVMIVLLAIIVGSIVVALYLPLIEFATQFGQDHTGADLQ